MTGDGPFGGLTPPVGAVGVVPNEGDLARPGRGPDVDPMRGGSLGLPDGITFTGCLAGRVPGVAGSGVCGGGVLFWGGDPAPCN